MKFMTLPLWGLRSGANTIKINAIYKKNFLFTPGHQAIKLILQEEFQLM